jgi:hypothetical protein
MDVQLATRLRVRWSDVVVPAVWTAAHTIATVAAAPRNATTKNPVASPGVARRWALSGQTYRLLRRYAGATDTARENIMARTTGHLMTPYPNARPTWAKTVATIETHA